MNKIILLCAIVFFAIGCEDAKIIASDGNTKAGDCAAPGMMNCIAKLCPNGYVVLEEHTTAYSTAIIRCK
jgi:hypothetical protein